MIEIGDAPPDFALPGIDGQVHALHDADGQPVLLVFMQAACPTCVNIAPYLSMLNDAYEDADWTFWTICQDRPKDVRDFVEELEYTPTVLIDGPSLNVSRRYDPDAMPTFFLIDPEEGVTFVSGGLDKFALNDISRYIANYAGADYVEVAPEGDGIPDMQLGCTPLQL